MKRKSRGRVLSQSVVFYNGRFVLYPAEVSYIRPIQFFHKNLLHYGNRHKTTFTTHRPQDPVDKIVELYEEKVALLERLLASEREKVEILKGK